MFNERRYQVLLLPEMEIAERACTLGEANAWAESYNRVLAGEPALAVIAEELSQESEASVVAALGV